MTPRLRIHLLTGEVIETNDDQLPEDDEIVLEEVQKRVAGPPRWISFGHALVFTSRIAAIELA